MEKSTKGKYVPHVRNASETVTAEVTPTSPDAKKKPVATVRAEDVSASIWARQFNVQGQPKTFYSVTIERSYKDRDGAWKYTKSFDSESLGKVVSVCQQASERIASLAQPTAA